MTRLAIHRDPQIEQFSISDAAIAEMAEAYLPLTIAGVQDIEGFRRVHEARMAVKNKRVEVEKVRKALKADAIEYGRKVDAEAKRITGLLEPIESHLEGQESAYQAEKERIKNEARLKAEAEARAKAEAEAARVRAEQEAEAARLRVEREKLEAERRAMDAERLRIAREEAEERARQKAEQDKIEAERRAVEAEKQRLIEEEAARLAAIDRERREKEAAEQARIETEARVAREIAAREAAAKAKAEAEEAARLRAEALRPDREKLLAVAVAVKDIEIPAVSVAAKAAADQIYRLLAQTALKIQKIADAVGRESCDDHD